MAYWTERIVDFKRKRNAGKGERMEASLTLDGRPFHTLGKRRDGEQKRDCVLEVKCLNVKLSGYRGFTIMFSESIEQSHTPERHLKENEHRR